MIKKIICICIVIIISLCVLGYSGKYYGFKEIELKGIGNIKIPQEWTCHIDGNKIYFTDESVEEFTEDSVHLAGYIYNEDAPLETYKMFDDNAESEGCVKGEVFSNSAYRGIYRYIMDGKRCEKVYLNLKIYEQDKEISMIGWDEAVSYEDVGKIAKSFKEKITE